MGTVPTHRGAPRPRSRHALPATLTRLAVVAGLALAGWLLLSALNGSAHAAQRDGENGLAGGDGLSALRHLVPGTSGAAAPAPEREPAPRPAAEPRPAPRPAALSRPEPRPAWVARPEPRPAAVSRPAPRPAAEPRHGLARPVSAVERDMRDLGDDPRGYAAARGRDVLAGEGRAVRTVRHLAEATGVRLPAVHPEGAVGGLVQNVSETPPGLSPVEEVAPPSRKQAQPRDLPGVPGAEGAATGTTRPGAPPAASPSTPDAAHPGGQDAAGDRGHPHRRHHAPGMPTPTPSGQDAPRGDGLSGGHGSGPVADLRAVRYPAVPPAHDQGAFHRAALVDLTAPGGPAVVPD
ncbi:hypothetical protein [Actinomadura litoris]|uniref:Uncharacterized protein n=1 Tax=Actinomadura litoris TaxID=2678616 RepID=A0A7K1L1X3_9ACTN|nr:hypothetical protein [Actinomadura litoris]MUN38402.1 hypothetical protein [Actinomadura litoris]